MSYTQEQLQVAFKLVQSPNWKDPIKSTCKESEVDVVMQAITHFAGGGASYSNKRTVKRAHGRYVAGDVIYDITAAGYYMVIGA